MNVLYIILIGLFLFMLSYKLDAQTSLFFKNIKFPIIDAVLSVITNFGVVVVSMLVVPSIMFYKNNKKDAYALWLSFAASLALAFIIKIIFLRQRPIEAFTYPFTNIVSYSFPSMHSMTVFSMLPLLVKYLPKHRHFWIIFAFLVAFSRIYFRLHFLSDVVFGALAGFFVGYLILRLEKRGLLWKSTNLS